MSFLFVIMPIIAGPLSDVEVAVPDARVKLIREVRVPAKETGAIVSINVKEGDLVKAGQSLGLIDDDLTRIEADAASLEQEISKEKSENDVDQRYAVKSLAVAQAELELSLAAVSRVPESISKSELERLRLVVEKSSLSIEQAQRDQRVARLTNQLKSRAVAAAQKRLARCKIVAPIQGMVVELQAQPGEWVNPGESVLRIVQLDRLRVEVNLDGNKYGAELAGRPVTFSVKVPPGDHLESFSGRITFVSPEVQPITGKVRVWAEVENPELKLRPGVHGTLTILAEPDGDQQ